MTSTSRAWNVSSASDDDHDPLDAHAERRAGSPTNRSWVSGRSGATPWRRIAMALRLPRPDPDRAGSGRAPTSLSSRTWRPVGMWTRTLSTTISMRVVAVPRPWRGLSHARSAQSREAAAPCSAPATKPPMWAKTATPAVDGPCVPSAADPVDHLEQEPEAEHDDGRAPRSAGRRSRGTRATGSGPAGTAPGRRPAPRRSRRTPRSSGSSEAGSASVCAGGGRDAADEVERRGTERGPAGPRRWRRRSTGTACCPAGAASRRGGTCS